MYFHSKSYFALYCKLHSIAHDEQIHNLDVESWVVVVVTIIPIMHHYILVLENIASICHQLEVSLVILSYVVLVTWNSMAFCSNLCGSS